MPRPHNLVTPEDLRELIDDYFKECRGKDPDDPGSFPDEAGMINYIQDRCSPNEDVDAFFHNCVHESVVGDDAVLFRRILERARRTRRSWLERTMVSSPKLATGCMNALKQEQNGGYIDRAKTDNDIKIQIMDEGLGIKPQTSPKKKKEAKK